MDKILTITIITVLLFFLIRSLYRHIKYIVRARRFGILKICIKTRLLLIDIGLLSIMSVLWCVFYSQTSTPRENIRVWTEVQSNLTLPGFEEEFAKRYNEKYAAKTGTVVTDVNRLCQKKLAENYELLDTYNFSLTFAGLIIAEGFVCIIGVLYFITESGLFTLGLDEPSEITVQRSGDKLHIYFEELPDKSKPHVILKNTPKNLAAVGRFIDCEPSGENEEFAQPPEP
ncbi:MAG: hypothetical protein K2N56_00610 [Oscillospiraceae bacterium]|nr:hypothetical protein [Oscillospiraceae bacterium]